MRDFMGMRVLSKSVTMCTLVCIRNNMYGFVKSTRDGHREKSVREDARAARREKIEEAAYELLIERGYDGTSMLSVAKRAKASNETLYRWYGDKQGLFKSLVERNAQDVSAFLGNEMSVRRPPRETIEKLGPILLGLLIGPRAIALNRAAAADVSGELGAAISEAGRNTVFPMIADVFEAARADSTIDRRVTSGEAAEVYVNLLVGDLQIRRAIGALPELTKIDITRRAKRAAVLTLELFGEGRQT